MGVIQGDTGSLDYSSNMENTIRHSLISATFSWPFTSKALRRKQGSKPYNLIFAKHATCRIVRGIRL